MDPIQAALTRPDGVAARLRRLRESAGLAAKDVAEATGFFPSKVSRLEHGRQTPSSDDIRAWVTACGADEATADDIIDILAAAQTERHAWRLRMRHGQKPVQERYNALAEASRTIRHFELVAVPGLVQTPEYARVMATEMVKMHRPDVDDVDQTVATKMERQRLLYEPDRRFEFLLAEPVLRWLLCPPAVMRGQLDRLFGLIGMPNVRFGILPLGVRLSAIPQNSVVIYVGDEVTVSVDGFAGATWYRGEESSPYVDGVDRVWSDAVESDDARRLIVKAIDALPQDPS